MAEKKAHEVDGWLKKPDPAVRIVLVYVTLPVIMRRELANASMNDPPDPGGGRSSG